MQISRRLCIGRGMSVKAPSMKWLWPCICSMAAYLLSLMQSRLHSKQRTCMLSPPACSIPTAKSCACNCPHCSKHLLLLVGCCRFGFPAVKPPEPFTVSTTSSLQETAEDAELSQACHLPKLCTLTQSTASVSSQMAFMKCVYGTAMHFRCGACFWSLSCKGIFVELLLSVIVA